MMLAGGALLVGYQTKAADDTSANTNSSTPANASNSSSMADRLSQKLNIGKDQVTNALNSIQDENQQKRKEQISANLDKAVSDGVITSDQKQQILDHQAAMQKQMDENRQWAQNSGINWSKLRSYHVGMMGGGPGQGMHSGWR